MESTIRDFLSRMDLYKFKEGVDPYQVIRLLLLAAGGAVLLWAVSWIFCHTPAPCII